jgi:hypothetical protein
MIDTLNFIEDLKEIRKSMPYTNITSELVDSKIKKYEDMVEKFEKENEPKEPLMVTGLANY